MVNERLAELYPDAECELDHENAFQLLIATILSAQATDVGVNKATPGLFARFPDASGITCERRVVRGRIAHLARLGLFRNKANKASPSAPLMQLMELHDGEVPGPMKDLVALPGVGRKTANVVRSVALGLPGLPVDTHVLRLSGLLGLTTLTDPVKVELELTQWSLLPSAANSPCG